MDVDIETSNGAYLSRKFWRHDLKNEYFCQSNAESVTITATENYSFMVVGEKMQNKISIVMMLLL